MRFALALFMVAAALSPPALAQTASYTWTGYGSGGGNCTSYKMKIDVTVNGTAVKGLFLQQGRTQRHFEATADASGAFKTKAQVGDGGTMDVKGTINATTASVLLDGYCKFDAKLKKI
jgi:hypothetical protein